MYNKFILNHRDKFANANFSFLQERSISFSNLVSSFEPLIPFAPPDFDTIIILPIIISSIVLHFTELTIPIPAKLSCVNYSPSTHA